MSVTPIRQSQPPPARRSGRRPNRQIAELQALGVKADQIRYACERMPAPVTTDAVRAWLLAREIEVCATRGEQVYTGRVVNAWLRERGEPMTPSAGIPIITDAQPDAEPVAEPVADEAPASAPVGPEPEPVTAPVAVLVASPVPPAAPPAPEPPAVPAVVAAPVAAPVAPPVAPAALQRLSHLLLWPAVSVLLVVAVASFVLSYESLQSKASQFFNGDAFGRTIAYGFPLTLDLFIVGASLAYLAGAVVGRALPGWRLAAHAAIGGTVVLNATAGGSPVGVLFHIVGPISFAVIVELAAKQLLLIYRLAVAPAERDSIPLSLWLTSPIEQTRTWLYMRRRGIGSAIAARAAMSTESGALMLLTLALPDRDGRQARNHLRRQLRSRAVTPAMLMTEAMAEMDAQQMTRAQELLRRTLAVSIAVANGASPTT